MNHGVPDPDAIRLLRRLSVRGARLIADANGHHRLVQAGRKRRLRSHEVDDGVVAAMRARGLIDRDNDGGLVATAVGRAALRRSLSGSDGFAAQHQQRGSAVVDDPAFGTISITVNHAESPLSWLRRRKGRDGRPLVDQAEFAAGERLRADYSRARLMPRVTANWTAAVADKRRGRGPGGIAELTEVAIAARRRLDKALTAVGPELSGVLVDFCCFLKGLEDIEHERQWPARSAKVVLRLGLSRLARHYGLLATASGPPFAARIHHWGADDYRPTVK